MAIKILQQIKNNNIGIILFVFYNCFNNKRIMFDQKTQITQEIDLHQNRKLFQDPKDASTHAITNLLIYCSQYYPSTKPLIIKLIDKLCITHQAKLYSSIEHLYKCLQREILYGPSSSYIPPSQIPHSQRLDNSFQSSQNFDSNKFNQFEQSFQTLGLLDIIPKGRIREIFWYSSSKLLSMKSVQDNNLNHRYYISELEIDGQNWLESTPFISLFVMISFVLQTLVNRIKLEPNLQFKIKLIRARLAQLHNKCLKNPVGKLADIVLTSYKEVIASAALSKTLEDHIQLLLQYAYSLLFFYKYSQSEQVVRHCAKLLKMKVEFTGKLGRRTKYQVFDTPQLIMNLVQTSQENNKKQEEIRIHDQQQGQKVQFIDPKQLVLRQKGTEKNSQKGISVSTFDEESILLQSPKFVEQQLKQPNKLKQINQSHLLVALAMLYLEWKSTAKDQMIQQSIAAAIITLLRYQVKASYSYSFSVLLLRSLNEFTRVKNFERALDQLQKLKTAFNGKADKDVSNIYSTPYQTCLGYVLVLADKYIQIGLSITAVQLYQQAGLYQECIDGLIFKNYKEKALELANQLIDTKGKNPRLLCMLGDIHNSKDPHFYEQAWQLSKGTYARAQRSLGWYYYNLNNFEKAAESFNKATQASYYHPNTWFTLGCCYMRLNQFDKALKAFSETISIDDSQGQAWGNMASCYMYQKKIKQAYSTLTQAVKHSQGNWKLWANLLSVSLSLKQFYKYFQCLEKIVKLGQHQIITEDILNKVVMIMRFTNQSDQRKRIVFNYKNRIDRLFLLFQEKIGQIPVVWRIKTKYLIELLEYYGILYVHYHNLHVQNQIDPNDLVPDYETIQSTQQNTKQRTRETKNMIVASKQYELNMNMNVGWHENKIQCQKVKIVLDEYVEIYKKYSEKADVQDFKLFVKGATQKISACFETVYQIKLQF